MYYFSCHILLTKVKFFFGLNINLITVKNILIFLKQGYKLPYFCISRLQNEAPAESCLWQALYEYIGEYFNRSSLGVAPHYYACAPCDRE